MQVDGAVVQVLAAKGVVECQDEGLAARVGKAVDRMRQAMGPCQSEAVAEPEK